MCSANMFDCNIDVPNSFLRTLTVFLSICEKWKLGKRCKKGQMILMLGSFLYFNIAYKAGGLDKLLCRLSSR